MQGLGFRAGLTIFRSCCTCANDMPNVNSGKPWSEMDIRDLKVALQYNRTVAEIADFLCRDVEEVEAKIAELRRH